MENVETHKVSDVEKMNKEEMMNFCAKVLLSIFTKSGCKNYIRVNIETDTREHYVMVFQKINLEEPKDNPSNQK